MSSARAPVVANRVASDARFAQRRDEAIRCGFHAKLTLPLSDSDQPIGLLNVYAQEEDAFDAEEVRLLDGMAQTVAVALLSDQHRRARSAAEAALRLRQRSIEACTNPIAITRFEEPGYPAQYVNPAFERVIGYPASAILGQGLRLLCHEDLDQPGVTELHAAYKQQRDGHAVIRWYRRDGSPSRARSAPAYKTGRYYGRVPDLWLIVESQFVALYSMAQVRLKP